jgi:hypothetical protein
VRLEHGVAVPVDVPHGLEQHAARAGALLADEEVVVPYLAARGDLVYARLLGPFTPSA